MSAKVKQQSDGRWSFKCPGCGHHHELPTAPEQSGPKWGFNGDVEKPTFTPSINMKSGHYVDGKGKDGCYYCEGEGKDDWDETGYVPCVICHSFVTDGMIQFLSDCTHPMAGQTVPLQDIVDGT